MKKIFRKEVIIGFTVALSLAILFVGIDYLKGINVFTPSNSYYVKFNNVTGLTISSPVMINGYQVGLVREITYDYEDNSSLKIQLSLDEDLKIPKGSVAVLAKDMLGTGCIDLKLSQNSDFYEKGGVIPGVNQLGLMDDINAKLLPAVINLMPKLDSILTNINALSANPALNASISRLDGITKNLEEMSIAVNKMAQTQLPSTLANFNSISSNFNTVSKDLTVVSSTLKSLPIDSTMNSLNKTSSNILYLTNKLKSKDSTLGLLMNDTGVYNNLNSTIKSADSLLIDVKKNPKRYVTFKIF